MYGMMWLRSFSSSDKYSNKEGHIYKRIDDIEAQRFSPHLRFTICLVTMQTETPKWKEKKILYGREFVSHRF